MAGWTQGQSDPQASGDAASQGPTGNLGDVKPVGEGVWEMREFFGPGWRMYYIQQGTVVIVMLGGGDKSTQAIDIATSMQLARLFKE